MSDISKHASFVMSSRREARRHTLLVDLARLRQKINNLNDDVEMGRPISGNAGVNLVSMAAEIASHLAALAMLDDVAPLMNDGRDHGDVS